MMDKYQSALIELARCTKAVKDISREIGEALDASRAAVESKLPTDDLGPIYPMDWDQKWMAGNFWLKQAFSAEIGEDLEPVYLSEREIRAYLAGSCMHAYRAYDLIKARQAMRKELGIAKRRVTFLANRLLESLK